jgi:hypothetical protein
MLTKVRDSVAGLTRARKSFFEIKTTVDLDMAFWRQDLEEGLILLHHDESQR